MTTAPEQPGVVSASREIAAAPERIFELIADPAQQPRWDGNDNLAQAPAGQRVRRSMCARRASNKHRRRCTTNRPSGKTVGLR